VTNYISRSHVEAIDRDYWSPAERAIGVNQIIGPLMEQLRAREPYDSPTDWDLLCWAVEYVGQQATETEIEPLINAAKQLAHVVYSLHYTHAARLYGVPDKRRARKEERKNADPLQENRQSVSRSDEGGDHSRGT
jgi:hypothetical protein